MDIVKSIKLKQWDNRVKRSGFLQSQAIVCEALSQKTELIKGISIKYDNNIWIKDICLYDDSKLKYFESQFTKAFQKDKNWPDKIVKFFDVIKPKTKKFISKLENTNWTNQPEKEVVKTFQEYINLLYQVQRYYCLAVPLTNYAEKKLIDWPEVLANYANPIKKLYIDGFNNSKNPLKEFAWVKSTYNIIHKLTEEDIEGEVPHTTVRQKKVNIPNEIKYLKNALQIGIYSRNRMKELSQQIWYYFDFLAERMAKDLKITKSDFYQLSYHEVFDSYKNKKLVINKIEIKKRHQGFVTGLLDNKLIILTGPKVSQLYKFFNNVNGVKQFSGTVASRGKVLGRAKIINNLKEFSKFKKGDILVTPMTSPDFVVIMKKAKAIVTDEGGLSCHAAIISRELGVPCIIGTKVATKVIKDNNKIEVDANKGLVRIIE
jgi:phosphohistidine swiveling domain-containing protein